MYKPQGKLKFTQARWQLSYLEHKFWIHTADQPKEVIARIGGMEACSITSDEIEANAYLMAHAPKMFKGLCKAIGALTLSDEQKELRTTLVKLIRQARGPL